MKKICLLGMAILSSVSLLHAADTLDMYVIDTEGGKALLIVSPAGESMLIDAGFPGTRIGMRFALRRRLGRPASRGSITWS